jgi:hypothetical protein
MEKYIQKINDKIVKDNDLTYAKKVKKKYQIIGGCVLGVGLAGFIASFITFMVLFFEYKTDDAFTAWIVAVPFLLMIVAGSVVSRIGDALLPNLKDKKENNEDKEKENNVD